MSNRQFPQLAALKEAAKALLKLHPTDATYSFRRRQLQIETEKSSKWLIKQLFPESADKCIDCQKLKTEVEMLKAKVKMYEAQIKCLEGQSSSKSQGVISSFRKSPLFR